MIRSMGRPGWITILACGCAAIAGCGSSAPVHPPAHPAGSGPAGQNGVTSAPPAHVLAEAAAAIRGAHSYAMQGALYSGVHSLHIKLMTRGPHAISVTFAQGDTMFDVIEVSGAAYIRGNAGFWQLHDGALASTLAGRWIEVPAAGARGETSLLGGFAPGNMARCLVEDHGTLSRAGTTNVDGRPAVVIKDAGNVPGGEPGELAVATTGAADPLRATATGQQRAGGHVDVCNDGKADSTLGTFTFSDFGQVPPIRPPASAIRMGGAPGRLTI